LKWLILPLLLAVLIGVAAAAITVEDLGDYEINQSLMPYLNAVCIGRNQTGALVLWFFGDEVPGNYLLIPKIGTYWVLTYKGETYNFIGISNDSRFRLERKL
jgi:hypothetical protein